MAITNIYEEKISNKKEQKVSEINSRGGECGGRGAPN